MSIDAQIESSPDELTVDAAKFLGESIDQRRHAPVFESIATTQPHNSSMAGSRNKWWARYRLHWR
jgi:hypothetical protein